MDTCYRVSESYLKKKISWYDLLETRYFSNKRYEKMFKKKKTLFVGGSEITIKYNKTGERNM